MSFALDPRLEADSFSLGPIPGGEVRLHRNAHYLWLILIPHVPEDVRDWHEVPREVRLRLSDQLATLSELVKEELPADKVNVATIGNMVPQLHLHVIGRRRSDPAWPGVVFGHPDVREYDAAERDDRLGTLRAHLLRLLPPSGNSEGY
mgnify:CR=1 FL=1